MKFVCLDFESYFADDFTLSKMTTESYIRDPRFIAHGAAIKWSANHEAKWYDEPELRFVLAQEDWSDVFMIHHHAQFDGLILSHHYAVHPKMFGDTLAMARLLIGNHVSVSLESVRKHFGFPPKTTPYNLFKNKHWNELTKQEQTLVADGACNEVESIWKIFNILLKDTPREEIEIVDITTKMFTEPCLRADLPMLAQVWTSENDNKAKRLADLNVATADLQSADRFAALLRACGVEPETKESTKGNVIYAFAKTDEFMRELQEHDDERVRTLAEARLGAKSTLLQTRAETLGYMARRRNALPVYLRVYGAHTTRWSGGDSCNWQNLSPAIEAAIEPPEGCWAFNVDASQIECRLLNFIAGQEDKIEDFRRGRDPYVGVAEDFCGHPVNKIDHPELRQAGKVVELQAGYQSGGEKIRLTLRNKAKIIITPEEGEKWKRAYRATHPQVEALWSEAGRMIARIAGGDPLQWGPVTIRDGKIWLPNGCPLHFPDLEYHVDNEIGDKYWRYRTRHGWAKLYGGKLVENCLSGLTQVLTLEGWKRIDAVQITDRVWDGVEFVSHNGLVHRGVQATGSLSGVRMTPDHLVLTQNGWVRAAQAQGLHWDEVRLPNGNSRCRIRWKETTVGIALRMWTGICESHRRFSKKPILRMYEKSADCGETTNAWHVPSPGLRGLVINARSLPVAITSSVGQLRRARNHCLQAVGVIRKLLGRYGANLQAGFDIGTCQEFAGVQFEKLHLGKLSTTGIESPRQSQDQDQVGIDNVQRSVTSNRSENIHNTISYFEWLAPRQTVHQTGFYEPVYDLMNCGPRHRFAVKGKNGPFIVHNCVQALARVVISQAMVRIVRLGYRVINTKHDSMWIPIKKDDDAQYHADRCKAEMVREPTWLPGIPLACEGELSERYSK